MTIRFASGTDEGAVLDLVRAFHREDGHPLTPESDAALTALLDPQSPHGFVLVAEAERRIVGYGAVCFGYSIEYGGRDAFVDDLYVVSAFRSAGVARALLTGLEAAAKERGVNHLHLEVMPGNNISDWYARRGYRDRNSRLMTKFLTPDT